VNDLEVDGKLLAGVSDDKDADAATAIVKGLVEAVEEAALVNDGKTLLDIAGLGHSDDTAVITDVEDTVLLEDWAKHVLDNNGWGGG